MESPDDKMIEGEPFRKLFIGGLDYKTTDEVLKSFYEQWGEVVDVVVMKNPETQKSRGFGFITYSKAEMVDDAMKNRPHNIDGRDVDSKRAVPRDEGGRPDANVNCTKMFVSGIKDQTEDDIRDYFATFGEIKEVRVIVDKETGKSKGYGFVEFTDYDPVDKAILYKQHTIGDKQVTVKKSHHNKALGGKSSSSRMGGGGGGGGGRGGGGNGGGRGGRGSGGRNSGSRSRGGNSWGNNQGNSGGFVNAWENSQPQNGWNGNNQNWNSGENFSNNGFGSHNGGWGGGGGGGGQGNNGGFGNSGGGFGNQMGGGFNGSNGGGPMRNNSFGNNRNAPYGGNRNNGGFGGGNNQRGGRY